MRYAKRVMRGKLVGLDELARGLEVPSVNEDRSMSGCSGEAVERACGKVRLTLHRNDPGACQKASDHFGFELIRDDRQLDEIVDHLK